jgi:HJR/Mrr/RecB family endonuclease
MKGRKRARSTDEQLAVITIFVAVVQLAAILRLFQQTTPTDLVGLLISGLGQLWVPALVATPVLVLWWRHVLRAHRAGERTASTRAQLRELSPEGFEEWSAKRLRELGYMVRQTGGQGDHGVDLIASKSGLDAVVQCKRYAGKRAVGEPEVRDLFGVMHHNAAAEAILITAGWFTPQAREWAKGKPIQLWDVAHLSQPLAAPPARMTSLGTAPARLARACPRCGAVLAARRNRGDGSEFIGCSAFPKCRFTETA